MDYSSIEKYVKMVQKTVHEEKLFKHFTDRSNDVECNKDSVFISAVQIRDRE